MSNPERPNLFDELTKCSKEVYDSPLHGENATRYLEWLRYPVGQVWQDGGGYYVSPVLHCDQNAMPIDLPQGSNRDDIAARGVELMTQRVPAPYKFVARTPVGHERGYSGQTLCVIDKGQYSMDRVRLHVERRGMAHHKLHGSLGALFDIICIASGLKKPDQAVVYIEGPSVTRRQVIPVTPRAGDGRVSTLNRVIDTTLNRQIQNLRPDKKGELMVQGRVRFGSKLPVVDWELMSYDALANVISRHSPSSQTRQILEQIVQSQNQES